MIYNWNKWNLMEKLAAIKTSPDVAAKLALVGNEDVLMQGLGALHSWFAGGFMGSSSSKSEIVEAIALLKKVSKVYHKPLTGKYYRSVHLRTNPREENADIMKRSLGEVSNKRIQSWSTDMDSAMFFFEHFCRDQNHSAGPAVDKAWVLLSTDSTNLNQLLTYDECMQFCWDVATTVDMGGETNDGAKRWVKHMSTDPEMIKLHELICEAKKEKIVYKVEKIMVETYKSDKPLQEPRREMSMEDMLMQLMRR